MDKKRFTLSRIKDGVIVETWKGTLAEAQQSTHGDLVLIKLDENYFSVMDEVVKNYPADVQERWKKFRPDVAEVMSNYYATTNNGKLKLIEEGVYAYR